ncbi:hypothetical protein HOP51_08250 [Halomonas sp. MCCC 1A11036]|uniref:Uncharacterized protein n=1 Tax=Billgrantia zhangzhouensis TaxID=2733481 RepID=A0ABS9AEF0_9GAMM|nr:hypothetical protein [Halomonas zhangzhouensis]MCE8020106.1 hypothetical protein [Halomonas zhangzhouensis]
MKMSALVAAVTAASLASSAWALDYDELRARANRVMGSVQSTPEEDIENPVAKLGHASLFER